MNYEQLSFVNQQLAGMLKSGIPLEGALHQVCSAMHKGKLRRELELLEADLSQGTPLGQALEKRNLPEFYTQMVKVGVQSNDLPSVLVLLADYYRRMNVVWTRISALMLYPLIVLLAACGLSLFIAKATRDSIHIFQVANIFDPRTDVPAMTQSQLWAAYLPAAVLGLTVITIVAISASRGLRRRLSWKIPVVRDAHLAGFADSLSLMIKGGCTLNQAIALLRKLEQNSPLGDALQEWERRLAQGHQKFSELASDTSVIPRLFYWLVSSEGEDIQTGLARASEIYHARTISRSELLFHTAVPASLLFVGVIVAVQLTILIQPAIEMFRLVTMME